MIWKLVFVERALNARGLDTEGGARKGGRAEGSHTKALYMYDIQQLHRGMVWRQNGILFLITHTSTNTHIYIHLIFFRAKSPRRPSPHQYQSNMIRSHCLLHHRIRIPTRYHLTTGHTQPSLPRRRVHCVHEQEQGHMPSHPQSHYHLP